ncbi:MAG: Ig domain-containing protein, partial [Desulfosarcinaceae bacterium]
YLFARLAGWNAPNHAPLIDYIPEQSTQPGRQVSFVVSASDAEGDAFVLSCSNLPAGAGFNADTGLFQWTPTDDFLGSYQVTFLAAETGNTDNSSTRSVTIIVGDDAQTPSDDGNDGDGGTGGGGCFVGLLQPLFMR